MKRITAVLLILLFIPLCSCGLSFDRIAEDLGFKSGGVSIEEEPAISGDIIKIEPGAVDLPCGELSAYIELNEPQKKLYSVMLTAASRFELGIIDVTGFSPDAFSDAVVAHRAILCDRPDIFWMPKTFSLLSVEGKDNKYFCFKDYFAEDNDIGYYGITAAQKSRMQDELNRVIDDIKSKTSGFKTAFEKELFLHDYICDNVTYDTASAKEPENAEPNSLTAYGALVKGNAICEGYAKAMQLLCIKCGIPCNVVYGENDGVSHMWNIVNPGDGAYYLDVTFDDSSASSIMHVYFNVTKEKLLKTHSFDESFETGKSYENSDSFNFFDINCNNTAFNYYVKTGSVLTTDCTDALYALKRAMLEGKSSVELLNKTGLPLNDAFALLRRSAAEFAALSKYYRYESENVLIAIW